MTETFGDRFGARPAPFRVTDEDFLDHDAVTHAAHRIAAHRGSDPVAIVAGTVRPHDPNTVLQMHFDLYPTGSRLPPDQPDAAIEALFAFARQFVNGENPDHDAQRRQTRLAPVRLADVMLGVVLDVMDASGRRDDTTVVLWSDHGRHLGDHAGWGAFTLREEAACAPPIVVDPGLMGAGARVETSVPLNHSADCLRASGPCDLRRRFGPPVRGTSGFRLRRLQGRNGATHVCGSPGMCRGDCRLIREEDGSVDRHDRAADPDQVGNLVLHEASGPLLLDLERVGEAQGIRFGTDGAVPNGAGTKG